MTPVATPPELRPAETARTGRAAGAGKANRLVALIGPPNVGKSTLFNRLTGLRQKTANYPGVTVEYRTGRFRKTDVEIIDLPGIWDMSPESEDERIAVDALRGELPGLRKPDAVLVVLDATQLLRQLPFAQQILALKLPTMIVINMADVLDRRSGHLDPLALAERLRAPVALVSATDGRSMDAVHRFLTRDQPGAQQQTNLLPILQTGATVNDRGELASAGIYRRPLPPNWSRRIDAVALHPVFGPLSFLLVVVLVFQLIFRVGSPLSDATTNGMVAIGNHLNAFLPAGWIRSLLVDGIWAGIGSVLAFLPQILSLFQVIAILEDSGYMARAAVISDRTMRRAGLNGRSFLPLLSAYACAVPAIMATRVIPNRRDRIATILIAPFMTCAARLPLYTMVITAFVPERHVLGDVLGLRAAVMIGLYVLGLVMALLTARLLGSSVMSSVGIGSEGKLPFVIELPEYRWPSLKSVSTYLVSRARIFLGQVGTVILVVSMVVWLMANLPIHHGQTSPIGSSYLAHIGNLIEPLLKPLGLNPRVGIAMLTAFVARETVVSTLGTLYGTEAVGHALRADIGIAGAISLLVFFAVAMQCTSTLATVRRETGSWKWPAAQFVYMNALAYALAAITFQILR
jgi:ferrous iron transport protein B